MQKMQRRQRMQEKKRLHKMQSMQRMQEKKIMQQMPRMQNCRKFIDEKMTKLQRV